jgi:hypothetical protein
MTGQNINVYPAELHWQYYTQWYGGIEDILQGYAENMQLVSAWRIYCDVGKSKFGRGCWKLKRAETSSLESCGY